MKWNVNLLKWIKVRLVLSFEGMQWHINDPIMVLFLGKVAVGRLLGTHKSSCRAEQKEEACMPCWKMRIDLWWGQIWEKLTELSGKCLALRGGKRALSCDIFSPGLSPRSSKLLSQKNFSEFILTLVPNTMEEAWHLKMCGIDHL